MSPFKIWRINKLEEEADAFPIDPARQVALFQALADADIRACYERIARRWERMCEFSPANPTLRDDEAFRLYVLSLVKTDQKDSIPSATRRRESILAKQAASLVADASATTTTAAAPEVQPDAPAVGPSASDRIAQSVLEDPKAHVKLNPVPEPAATAPPTSPAASLATSAVTGAAPASGVQALLAAGVAGGKDAPIYVTIAQRELMCLYVVGRLLTHPI